MRSEPSAEDKMVDESAPALPEPTSKRLLRNSFSQAAAKAVTVLSTFAVLAILARSLPAVEYGAWGVTYSAFSIVLSLDMGIGAVLLNRTAQLVLRGQESEARDHVFSAAIGLVLFGMGLAGLFFLWPDSLAILGLPTHGAIGHAVRVALALGGLYLFPGATVILFYVWQEAPWIAVNDSVRSVLAVLAVALVAWLGGRILQQAAVFYGLYILTGLAAVFYLWRRRGWNPLAYWRQTDRVERFARQIKSMLAEGSMFAFLNAATVIGANIDSIIVAHVTTLEAAGPYTTLQRLYVGLFNLNLVLFFSYWSAFTIKYEQRNFAWLRRVILLTGGASLAMGVGFMVAMMIGGPALLRLWTGLSVPGYGLYVSFGLWVTVSMLVSNLSTFLKGIGRVKRQAVFTVLAVVLNVPLGLWLGRRYGLVGVNAATTIAMTILLVNNLLETRNVLWVGRRSIESGVIDATEKSEQ